MKSASTKTIAHVAAKLAAAAFLVLATVGSASAIGGCAKWMCGDNGTQLDGLRLQNLQRPDIGGTASSCPKWACGSNGTQLDGIRLDGVQQPARDAAALPSGEAVQPVSGRTERGAAPNVLKNKNDAAKNTLGHMR
jgi:hypothetical protein